MIGIFFKFFEQPKKIIHQESSPLNPLLESVIDHLPIAIACRSYENPKEKIVLWNRESEKLWGLTKEQVLGKSNDELQLIYEAKRFPLSDLEVLASGKETWDIVERKKAAQEEKLTLKTLRVPLSDSSKYSRYLIEFSLDISSQMDVEQKLLEAKDVAEQALRTKAQWVANVSHEIKTPLNGILGICDLLLDKENDKATVERILAIVSCGKTLLALVNDILDFSKLEAQKIEIQHNPISIKKILQEITNIYNHAASTKGLILSTTVEPSVPEWILGDAPRLRQILSNLVGNAIKFTLSGKIRIVCRAKNKLEGNVEIEFEISDTGLGISEEARANLFTLFSQGNSSTTRLFGGTGVGLVICKGLCERMNGRIWVESKPGVGSQFFFTLPVQEVQGPKWEQVSETGKSLLQFDTNLGKKRPLKIMIVEDNRLNQIVLSGMLEKLGYGSTVAWDGEQALELLGRESFDLVLMDCHMPKMDGFEAARLIKQTVKPEPRVIGVTASDSSETLERCYASGMSHVILKPISMKKILEAIFEIPSLEENEKMHKRDRPAIKPVIKMLEFQRRFKGLETLALEMIQDFLKSLPQLTAQIHSSIHSKDSRSLELAAHTLKGAVANFYSEDVQLTALSLEEMGRKGNFEYSEALFQTLILQLEDLKRSIPELIKYLKRGGA